MEVHDPLFYKDVHVGTVLPKITMDTIEGYTKPFKNNYDFKKIEERYKEKHIWYIKSLKYSGFYYINAQVRASMKSTGYTVDIKLHNNGTVEESQCECLAGMGPDSACDHRVIALFGLCEHSNGEAIISEETCTERLQTFHTARPSKGSPVKAADIAVKGTGRTRKWRARPLMGGEEYQDLLHLHFWMHNVILNIQLTKTN